MDINHLISAEQFLRMPDPPNGAKQELVRGEVITMPGPGGLHGVTCARISRRIGNFVDDRQLGWVMGNDTGFLTHRDPDTVRGADVAYWSKQRLPEVPVGYLLIAPDLGVEVLSPSNTSKQIREKIEEYFACGVAMVWVVAPEDRNGNDLPFA
jgi:Uma2 family endonuclease